MKCKGIYSGKSLIIIGVKNEGKGFTSQEGVCFIESYLIALDSKARLVLPLEIREAIGVKRNERILFGIKQCAVGAGPAKQILITISKASDSAAANSVTSSKNCAYIKRLKGEPL